MNNYITSLANYLFKKIKWLWLDNFTKVKLSHKFYGYLKRKKVKICMVSPELVKKSRENDRHALPKYSLKQLVTVDGKPIPPYF